VGRLRRAAARGFMIDFAAFARAAPQGAERDPARFVRDARIRPGTLPSDFARRSTATC
jgi:hypothetical protein